MKKILLTCAAVAFSAFSHAANTKTTYNVSVIRNVNKTEESTTRFQVNTDLLCQTFGRTDAEAINTGLKAGTIKLHGKQGSTNKTVTSSTYGTYGYWFTAKGVVVAVTSTSRRVACKYEDGYFKITHWADKVAMGDKMSFAEMFIQGTDTVQYVFDVTMQDYDKVTSDQPAFNETIKHRTDKVETWGVTPSVRQNDQTPLKQNYIQVMAGDRITLDCVLPEGATSARFSWKNRKGVSLATLSKTSEWVINSATPEDAGYYVLSGRYSLNGQTKTFSNCNFYVDVQTEKALTYWDWTGEVPALEYNFRTEYPELPMPTKVHNIKKKNGQKANYVAGEWWSIFWGDNLNSACGNEATTRKAAENMVKKYDEDFAYIRDNLGWPPDLSAREGYKSFIYIFGSGLSNDNESSTTEGGYQSSTYVDGKQYACVWASFLPFSRFRDDADKLWKDGDYQRESMIHEGIHAIFADLDACKGSSWFHEGGNTWLQKQLHAKREGVYGEAGFLDGGPFVAPFMPIECYSGWLQDGSFGGPAAQGVNMFDADGQVCTWRAYLGGVQYANSFPTVLATICGEGSVGWIWRNCKNRVLETIGGEIGDEAMRKLITQYRARQVLFDLDGWDKSYRDITDAHFGESIRAEYRNGVMTKKDKSEGSHMPCWIDVEAHKLSPYQALTKNTADGWYAPDTLTNPGWSGANIIPIHIDGDATKAVVEFRPEDTEMRALLCYRTKEGKCYYSKPVQCGPMTIDISNKPANDVVFCMICNTDWEYKNDNQRKKHWDYRLKLGENALAIADNYQRWYFYEKKITDPTYDKDKALDDKEYETPVETVQYDDVIKLKTTTITPGCTLTFETSDINPTDVNIHIVGATGVIVDAEKLDANGCFTLPSTLPNGVYFLCLNNNSTKKVFKIFVRK